MVEFPKILFPLDFSATAPTVAEHVKAMANKFGSELHVIHVIPTYDRHAFASYGRVMEEIKERVCGEMAAFVKDHLPGIEVITDVVSGHAGRQIIEYADQKGISLIIMGTHGRSELSQLVFGSVAQRVVQNSVIPVMTINPVCLSDAGDGKPLRCSS
jgi:nucleotide-binding universal stress UspA family protein